MAGQEPIVDPVAAPASAEPAPAPAPAGGEPAQHPHEVPTLLETFKADAPAADPAPAATPDPKAAEPPAADPKPADPAIEAKVEEPKPEGEEPPAFDWDKHEFTFADGLKADDKQVAAFKDQAREAGLSPDKAQGFVDLFNTAASAFVTEQGAKQNEAWNSTRAGWRKEVLADPMVGGAGHLHAMGVTARVRDMSISDAQPGTPQYDQDAKEYEDFLRTTGAGDHPAYIKQLYRLGSRLDEPKRPTAVPNPPKNNGVRPTNSLYAPKRQ